MRYQKTSSSVEPFAAKGFNRTEFFNHNVAVIQKRYPDTFLLLEQRGIPESELQTGTFYQINVYSRDLSGLPNELFLDPKLNWHNQQLGEKGLIAAAGLYARDSSLTVTVMQSDLCQQLYRHAELKRTCKTQVEKRFGAWHRVLFNAILDFAFELGFSFVYTPTSDWIITSTKKHVQPDLFRRIYDFVVNRYECRKVTRNRAQYWEIPLLCDNADRVVRLAPTAPVDPKADQRPLICLFHDIEENVDTDVPVSECCQNLVAMLNIEKSRGVQTTYNILGTRFLAKQQQIRNFDNGHCLGFHSFDHDLNNDTQLMRCREVDLQVKGYRPPQSVITSELTDYRLSYFNFEWFASGKRSLGLSCCTLQNGIVKIPILTDDFPIFTGQQDYGEWELRLLEHTRSRSFVAFSLHDCYAKLWIKCYGQLLDKLSSIGSFVTADEMCDRVFLQQGTPFPIEVQ